MKLEEKYNIKRRKLRNLRAYTCNLKNKRSDLLIIKIINRVHVRWAQYEEEEEVVAI